MENISLVGASRQRHHGASRSSHPFPNQGAASCPLRDSTPIPPRAVEFCATGGDGDIARGTYLPIATGERIFTKWGFREILEKKAATILQPDLCHAGGIMDARLIAGMAEAFYCSVAPHNPLGPISLARHPTGRVDSEFPVPGTDVAG